MSSANGQMLICDRCGAWTFLKCTGEGELDGGYTRWNEFEDAPGWDRILQIGDVCPKCRQDYEDMLEKYKNVPPKIKEN